MYIKIRRRRHGDRPYEYVDIVESFKSQGKVGHRTLGSLGRRDQLPPEKVDTLIAHLRKLASPEGSGGVRLGEVEVERIREFGIPWVAHHLWQQLGMDQLLRELPHPAGVPLEEAIFRMVMHHLCQPGSKLALVDWVDEHQTPHQGWQQTVQWPGGPQELGYHQYLRAMDCLHPHRQALEEALFPRVTDLLSLPLRLVFYDLTSTYFEGDGVCELADYGYSRDHRGDRSQVVVGLAVTQEGVPITHKVFSGSTVDVTTLRGMTGELRERFGLTEPVLVADRGMFSGDNVTELEGMGQLYILALRSRQQLLGSLAVLAADQAGLERPRDPGAKWSWREVSVHAGPREVVVYSPFKALHDFEVRSRRIRTALQQLGQLQRQAADLDAQTLTERAVRILVKAKCRHYFQLTVGAGQLRFHLHRAYYRTQRRHDGVLVLETNHPAMTAAEIVEAYRQEQEVERVFRLLKSLLRMRPIYHHRQRRVETHIFICFLAVLLAKLLELRLRAAGSSHSAAHALAILRRLQAVEQTWQGSTTVVQLTKPDPELLALLEALGVKPPGRVLAVSRRVAA